MVYSIYFGMQIIAERSRQGTRKENTLLILLIPRAKGSRRQ
jgi:hypothetical protein